RARVPDAGGGARRVPLRGGKRRDPVALRPRSAAHEELRDGVPGGASAGRARRPLHPDLSRRRRQRRVGRPRRAPQGPREGVRGGRPPHRGPPAGPPAPGAARRDARGLGVGVRPGAGSEGGIGRPRAPSLRFLRLAGGRRGQRRHRPRRDGRDRLPRGGASPLRHRPSRDGPPPAGAGSAKARGAGPQEAGDRLRKTHPGDSGMTRMAVKPEAVDFESRGRRDYLVTLEHPTLWGAYLIPVTVVVGPQAKPGRGLVATGSTHGNEYEGPVALKHLVREIRTEDVLGRIILIPVLNAVAFKAGRRDSPDDGVNLNRAFPGDAKGTITSRIADFVTRFVFPQVHVVLDLHAGGQVARFPQLASMHDVDDAAQKREMLETAKGFGCRFLNFYQNSTPGLLTSTAESLGKVTVGGEFGWGEALQHEGVSMCRQGVLTTTIRHKQMRGPAPANRHFKKQITIDTSDPASTT